MRLAELCSRIGRNEDGGVAILFAVSVLPLLAMVGTAVDYHRAAGIRTQMQAAIDAAGLALSKEISKLNDSEINQRAQEFFLANFRSSDAKNVSVEATYVRMGDSRLDLQVRGQVPAQFLGMFGTRTIDVAATSTIRWGTTRLRVALALDVTGSMQTANKMQSLKNATKNLLDYLQDSAKTDGDILVSIVPFAKNVNVGDSNYTSHWIDWTDWEAPPSLLKKWIDDNPQDWDELGPNDTCPFDKRDFGFTCVDGPGSTREVDRIPSSGRICPGPDNGRKIPHKNGIVYNGCYDTKNAERTVAKGRNASCGSRPNCSCSGSGSNRICKQTYKSHTWIPNDRRTWNGCVTDRGLSSGPSGDYDRKAGQPGSTPESKFPAEQYRHCPQQLLGLSHDWSAMKTLVDSFQPNGATNQPIGLVWAWQTLTGGGPVAAPPKDNENKYHEAIILMSDGLNTLNRWSGNGSDPSAAVDKRMLESATVGTCANIKEAGITIYAIQVNTDKDPESTLLKNCASGSDKFWMITNAADLDAVFQNIGKNLTKLRVAK